MATQNNFKSSSICGNFTNSDYPNGSILANGTFNRDLYVKGNLYLGNETGVTGAYVDTGANINFTIKGVVYTVTPAMLQILITLSSQSLATQTYVNNQIAALVASAPATLDTLNELAAALGNDPNFATTTATNIASKVSIASVQNITGVKTFSSANNVFYGSGANLTNIKLTTTTMPSTGTYYLPYTTSATGASGLTPYSDNQISFDRTNNKLVVPNLNMFGTLTMTGATPIITPTGNYNLVFNTPSVSTGSLIFQTQGQAQFTIGSDGISRFYNCIEFDSTSDAQRQIMNTYYNLQDTDTTVGGIYRGRIYSNAAFVFLELNAGHNFMITIGGTRVFQVDSTALTTNVPVNIITTVSSPTASLTITDSVTSNRLNFSPALGPGTYNRIVSTNDSVIFSTGSIDNETLVLTTHSNTCGGIRLTATSLVLGIGGIIDVSTPLTNMTIDGTDGTMSITANNGINLNASYLYGRNDGAAFNEIGANGLYPIGYTVSYLPNPITFTSGTALTFVSPALSIGVWLVSGWGELTRGTGTYLVTSYMRTVINKTNSLYGNMTPIAFGASSQFPIPSTATNATIQMPISGVCVSTNNLCTLTISLTTLMTVGTATMCPRVSFTKIA